MSNKRTSVGNQATQQCESLRLKVEQTPLADRQITVSIGIATLDNETTENPAPLIKAATQALNRAIEKAATKQPLLSHTI